MKFSRWGLVLSGLYVGITSVIFYQAFTCGDMYCGLIAIAPVLPWPLVAEVIQFPEFLDSKFGLYFFAIVNIYLLYWSGSVIERWYKSRSLEN